MLSGRHQGRAKLTQGATQPPAYFRSAVVQTGKHGRPHCVGPSRIRQGGEKRHRACRTRTGKQSGPWLAGYREMSSFILDHACATGTTVPTGCWAPCGVGGKPFRRQWR